MVIDRLIIYSSIHGFEDNITAVETVFRNRKFDIKISGGNITIVNKKLFSKQIVNAEIITHENAEDKFCEQINKLKNRMSEEKYQDEETKKSILTQASCTNAIIVFESDGNIPENVIEAITEVVGRLCAMALSEDGVVFNNEFNPIYDSNGIRTEANFNIYADGIAVNIVGIDETNENTARKQISISRLKELGIPVVENMPVLPDSSQAVFRSKDDICERMVSLMFLIQYACEVAQGADLDNARDSVVDLLNKYEVLDCLTPSEQQFLYRTIPDVDAAVKITWQYEACWILAWALGYAEDLGLPDEMSDSEDIAKAVLQFDCYDDFYDNAALRPKTEILDHADFTYRLDLACVSAKAKKTVMPHNINSKITAERNRAFSWLLNSKGSGWDDVTLAEQIFSKGLPQEIDD